MSEDAKDRVLAVGTRFTTLEHENQHVQSSCRPKEKPANQSQATKVPFWKRGTGTSKVPGRYV